MIIMTIKTSVVEFGKSIASGIKANIQGSEIYVKCIDRYGAKAQEAFSEAYPEISAAEWLRREALGRKHVCPEMGVASFQSRKMLERLPVAQQKLLLTEGPMVYYKHDQPHQVPAMKLPTLLVSQVFSVSAKGLVKIRGLKEQENWRIAYDEARKESTEPYVIRNGTLIVRDGRGKIVIITVPMLSKEILPEMKRQLKCQN